MVDVNFNIEAIHVDTGIPTPTQAGYIPITNGVNGYTLHLPSDVFNPTVPAINGGTTGQVLEKLSSTNGDYGWATLYSLILDDSLAGLHKTYTSSNIDTLLAAKVSTSANHDVPAGGSSGFILGKTSGTDYNLAWLDPSVLVAGGAYQTANGTPSGITGTYGTIPSGGTLKYEWTQIGNTVILTIVLHYGSVGATVTLMNIPFGVNNFPTPVAIGGISFGAGEIMYPGTVYVGNSATIAEGNSASNHFHIIKQSGDYTATFETASGSVRYLIGTVSYKV